MSSVDILKRATKPTNRKEAAAVVSKRYGVVIRENVSSEDAALVDRGRSLGKRQTSLTSYKLGAKR